VSSAATSALVAAIFDEAADDQAWLRRMLEALCGRVSATAGLAYAWGLPGLSRGPCAAVGHSDGADAAIDAVFALPRRWFLQLHRVPRGQAKLDRQWVRLPQSVQRDARQRLGAWSGVSQVVYTVVPIATRESGLCLLLATPRDLDRAPRAKETLHHLVEHMATAFALRNRPFSRAPVLSANEGAIWRDLFNGKWAVLRSKRTAAASELVLARPPARSRRDPRTFTGREQQVLALALEGRSNKWIGWRIGLATATVASHMQRMSSKLGVRTRTELLSFFGPTEAASMKRCSVVVR
jgi:DNA-binding CsgD family transcriptional regulator